MKKSRLGQHLQEVQPLSAPAWLWHHRADPLDTSKSTCYLQNRYFILCGHGRSNSCMLLHGRLGRQRGYVPEKMAYLHVFGENDTYQGIETGLVSLLQPVSCFSVGGETHIKTQKCGLVKHRKQQVKLWTRGQNFQLILTGRGTQALKVGRTALRLPSKFALSLEALSTSFHL